MKPEQLRQIAARLERGEEISRADQRGALTAIRGLQLSVVTDPFSDTDAAIDLVRECFPGLALGLVGPHADGTWCAGLFQLPMSNQPNYRVAPTPAAAIMAAACRAKAEQMEQKK
jgi:hypothetical protein